MLLLRSQEELDKGIKCVGCFYFKLNNLKINLLHNFFSPDTP